MQNKVVWVFVATVAAAFLLAACYMWGKAVHDSDVLRHDQEITCIKAGGVPVYDRSDLQCRHY